MATRRERVEIEDQGNIRILKLIDGIILDEQNMQQIGEDIFKAIDTSPGKDVVLSFRNVGYLSSATMGKFATAKQKVEAKHGKLVLIDVEQNLYKVFEMTKAKDGTPNNEFFTIMKGEQEALDALSRKSGGMPDVEGRDTKRNPQSMSRF